MAFEQEEGMPVETPSLFAAIIQEHLELKRRNAALEHEMPIQKYMVADPFENHPLFKSEEQARVEDTMDGTQSIVDEPTSLDWPTSEDVFAAPAPAPTPAVESDDGTSAPPAAEHDADEPSEEVSDESLWSRSRDFDWGD
jgi:hypothetical protein